MPQYLRLKGKTDDLENQLASAYDCIGTLNSSFDRMAQETLTLHQILVDYNGFGGLWESSRLTDCWNRRKRMSGTESIT